MFLGSVTQGTIGRRQSSHLALVLLNGVLRLDGKTELLGTIEGVFGDLTKKEGRRKKILRK